MSHTLYLHHIICKHDSVNFRQKWLAKLVKKQRETCKFSSDRREHDICSLNNPFAISKRNEARQIANTICNLELPLLVSIYKLQQFQDTLKVAMIGEYVKV